MDELNTIPQKLYNYSKLEIHVSEKHTNQMS